MLLARYMYPQTRLYYPMGPPEESICGQVLSNPLWFKPSGDNVLKFSPTNPQVV